MSRITYDQFAGPTCEPDLLAMTLHVSENGRTWSTLVFEGESAKYLDRQVAAFLNDNHHLLVETDQDTAWGDFPKTFDAIYSTLRTRPAKAAAVQFQPLLAYV